jgi:hypothetical protein
MEGSISKIVSHEGGISIVGVWGVSPLSHDDDSARAVLAA